MKHRGKNTAEVFVQCLEARGISHIFGVPGEENLTFLEAVRNSKITFITTRDERAAAFMASTFGRLTGKVGVVLSTLGPGATNLMTGIAYAELGGFPLLAITGQKAIKKSKQGKFQIVDIVAMMQPITKFSATINTAERVQNIVEKAINLAETERPGAVHLELPEDIAEEICKGNPIAPFEMKYGKASEREIMGAIREIEKSKHPIIILGRGANRKTVEKELQAFLDKTGIPFVSTQMGKGSASEDSLLYIGTTSLSSGDFVHQALRQADAIVLIGHDVVEKPPIILTSENSRRCKVIHINFFPSSAKNVYTPTHKVVGDIAETLRKFTKNIRVNPAWDFSYFFKMRDASNKDAAIYAASKDFPLRPERIIGDIQKILGTDGMLTLDNGMYKLYFSRNFVAKEQNSIILDNTLATMGAGLPSGIALKILYPRRKIIVVSGDGGIMMSIGELETAVRLKIDLVVLILDDFGFGMIRWKQKAMNLYAFGLSFGNPDFVLLAKSFGAVGHKVEKAEDLAPLLEKTLNSKGVHIIACPIDYDKANETLGKLK